jgi:hypothetical protein
VGGGQVDPFLWFRPNMGVWFTTQECPLNRQHLTRAASAVAIEHSHSLSHIDQWWLRLRLDRTDSGGVARESGEGEQDRDGPRVSQ